MKPTPTALAIIIVSAVLLCAACIGAGLYIASVEDMREHVRQLHAECQRLCLKSIDQGTDLGLLRTRFDEATATGRKK
jgi:hypothetical protein